MRWSGDVMMPSSVHSVKSRASTASNPLLADVLAQRRWIQRVRPFPHVIAYDVFKPSVYSRLEDAFLELLEETAGRPYLKAHEIHGRMLGDDVADRFDPLLARPWHDLLARILKINATGHIAAGMHHHQVGSRHGFPHNDLNSGWFPGDPAPGRLVFSGPAIDYTTGTVLDEVAGCMPVETVRAASALFYLANPAWEIGDGGATGLYRSDTDDIEHPVAVAPPLNNSLLMFECTPASYHGFISNRRNPRNSIVMWLHRPKKDVLDRWGESAIVPYGRTPKRKAAP
jgi:2OG-Fe(II) oxygenase superfamily